MLDFDAILIIKKYYVLFLTSLTGRDLEQTFWTCPAGLEPPAEARNRKEDTAFI